MEINTSFKTEVYHHFKGTNSVIDILDRLEKEEFLEARYLMASSIDTFRANNSIERPILTAEEVDTHNEVVEKLTSMEATYSAFMMMLEEHELLPK